MNIIIRLQNLPWSANASDIRQFFKGLHIPEGGVHIVGGENGDAFIAFSTDEDARQAMSMSGQKLKEVQVLLHLSSRAEMQKVIEKARMMTMSSQKTLPTQALPSAEAFTNQFGRKVPDVVTLQQQQQQPSIASYQQSTATVSTPLMNLQMKPNDLLSSLQAQPALTANQLPLYNYNQLNSVEYLNYVKMANAAGNFHLDNNQLKQSVDPYGRERQRSRSPISRYDSDEKKERRRRSRFSSPDKTKPLAPVANNFIQQKAPAMLTQHQLHIQQQHQPVLTSHMLSNPPAKVSNGIWDVPPMNLNSYSSFNGSNNNNNLVVNNSFNQSQLSQRSYQTVDNKAFVASSQNYQTSSSSYDNDLGSGVGKCIKVANVGKEVNYSDIRKFFALPIDDIKFLKDDKGNHTGVALVRFISSDSKKQSMTKNGWQLKSTQIMITSITEEDYDRGLDSKSSGNRRNNHEGLRRDRYNDRYSRDRSDSREREYDRNSRERDRDRGGDRFNRNRHQNNRFDNRGNNNNNNNNNNISNNRYFNRRREDGANGSRFNRRENSEPEEVVEYVPDEKYTVLVIDDIPEKNEQDLLEAFPNIVSVVNNTEKYTAYCKFTTHDAAKAVLENRFLHYIRNKRVFIETGSEAQFNDYAKKYGKYDNPEMKDFIEKNESESSLQSKSQDSNSSENSSDMPKPSLSRDPRQRAQQNGSANNNGIPNLRTDCILVKNLEMNCSIDDVENFFSDDNMQKNNMRIHILLDKKGQPCGDCFIEFKHENDLKQALLKNNSMMGQNKLAVMPIPREQVEAVLSSFGDDNGRRQQNRPTNNSNEWAPPIDFGSPGCVVMISNLCYRATVDDIIDEFREFDLHPDQIIRRYNDMGQPTGNACVNFNSPRDADKACDSYNKIKILNRPIWLRRL